MISSELQDRIDRFKHMADADPHNELGHFSLGKAFLEAGRFAEAAAALRRALELNPTMSKGYQLLGEALEKGGQRKQAIEAVTRGATVADEQGDRAPLSAMVALLNEWNAPVPTLRTVAPSSPGAGTKEKSAGEGVSSFSCSRCGRPGGKLEKPPFRGPLGEKIWAHVCQSCWREWIPMGTKVINELGLSLRDPAAQKAYDQYMIEFLQLEEA